MPKKKVVAAKPVVDPVVEPVVEPVIEEKTEVLTGGTKSIEVNARDLKELQEKGLLIGFNPKTNIALIKA